VLTATTAALCSSRKPRTIAAFAFAVPLRTILATLALRFSPIDALPL